MKVSKRNLGSNKFQKYLESSSFKDVSKTLFCLFLLLVLSVIFRSFFKSVRRGCSQSANGVNTTNLTQNCEL
jgi:hypothetical protein